MLQISPAWVRGAAQKLLKIHIAHVKDSVDDRCGCRGAWRIGGILCVPLSDDEIDDVTAYILTLEPAAGLPAGDEAPSGLLGSTVSWFLFAGAALILVVILIRYYQKA
jgi:hypothetical protein